MQKKVLMSSVLLTMFTLSVANAGENVKFIDVINTPVGVFASDVSGNLYKESEIGSVDWTDLGSYGNYSDVKSIKYVKRRNSYGNMANYIYVQTDNDLLSYDIDSSSWDVLPLDRKYSVASDNFVDFDANGTGEDLESQYFFWSSRDATWKLDYSFFKVNAGLPVDFTSYDTMSGYVIRYFDEDELPDTIKSHGLTTYPSKFYVQSAILSVISLVEYDVFKFSEFYGELLAPELAAYSNSISGWTGSPYLLGLYGSSSDNNQGVVGIKDSGIRIWNSDKVSGSPRYQYEADVSGIGEKSFTSLISERVGNNFLSTYSLIGGDNGQAEVINLKDCAVDINYPCMFVDAAFDLNSQVKYVYDHVVAGNLIIVTADGNLHYYNTDTKSTSKAPIDSGVSGIKGINDHIIYIMYGDGSMVQYDFTTERYTNVGKLKNDLTFDKLIVKPAEGSDTIMLEFLAVNTGVVQDPIYYNYYITNTDTGQLVSYNINLESGKYQVDVAPGHYRVTVVAQDQYFGNSISGSVNVTIEGPVKKYDFDVLKDLTIDTLSSDYVVVSFAIAKQADAPAPQNTVIAFEEKNLDTGGVRTGTIKKVDGAYLGKLAANTDYELTYTITADNYNTLVRSVSYKTLS